MTLPDLQRENHVVIDGRVWSWAELAHRFADSPAARVLAAAGQPAAMIADSALDGFTAVAGMAAHPLDALLLGRERLTAGVEAVLDAHGFSRCERLGEKITPAATSTPAQPGRISLLTSGSTGTPKLVAHRWQTLFTAQHRPQVAARRWLNPYQVGTYAWFQCVTLGLFLPGQAVVVPSSDDFEAMFLEAAAQRVDSISATPTFWRLACFRVADSLLRSLPLTTVTLGGELADQAILDRLAALFPAAQITHIYASTEAGACIVVKDGRAGFPASFLDRERVDAPELRVRDGRLWIRSPFSTRAADGAPGEWLDSGDLVEIRGDRVHFLGRADTKLINVGGNKAYPADIEAVLLAHPAVRWCRVHAIRSPLVGHLPEAQYVPSSPENLPDEAELTEFCASRLPAYAVPRFWTPLPEIPVQNSLKSAL